MASRIIFTPTVNSYEPAFLFNGDCEINFTLSDFNSISQIGTVHATVYNLNSGNNVVNKDYSQGTPVGAPIYTATGTIFNLSAITVDESKKMYKVVIKKDYINRGSWDEGGIYKIQLRLTQSNTTGSSYSGDGSATAQNAWQTENAQYFSEWSSVIITKATGISSLDIPILEGVSTFRSSTLDIYGTYSNTDESETVYSYTVSLAGNNRTEQSETLYTNAYSNNNEIKYGFRTEMQYGVSYTVTVNILTTNKYEYTKTYTFTAAPSSEDAVAIGLKEIPSMRGYEQDEGCIALQIYSTGQSPTSFTGTLRIRRTDQFSNYEVWEDICQVVCSTSTIVDTLPPYFDFTAISGVRYKYGIQKVVESGSSISRSPLVSLSNPIYREFEYSYLVGQGLRQLKLPFDCNISNMENNIEDGVIKTIGSKYPFVIRGGEADYKSFSLSGKISFNMDDNHLFIAKDFLEGYTQNTYISPRDFTYERAFRDEVNKFLKDGKPKIFKSPTEGNLIVRVTNVSLSPETSLSRLIYNFSCNVVEIDEAILSKYKEYRIMSDLPNLMDINAIVDTGHTHETGDVNNSPDFPRG